MKLRLLDKYIFREVFATFLFAVCAFTTVFVGSGTLFRIAQYVTEYGASLGAVVKVFVFSLPSIVIWTFPMSILLGTLLAFGRLSGSSEIVAMKSCGVSFWRIAAPALALGLAVSAFTVWFAEYVLPWANSAYSHVVNYEIKHASTPRSQDHVIIKDISHGEIRQLVYARRFDANKEMLQGITMQVFQEGHTTHVETAEYAKWHDAKWSMYNGIVYNIPQGADPNNTVQYSMTFSEQALPIDMNPREISRAQKRPEELTIKELKALIALMREQFVSTKKVETELYQRFTIPFASFVFALIGVPLGIQPNRSSSSRGFGISLVVIFIYYALMTMGGAFAQGGVLPAFVAVWIPNLVGMAFGAYFMRKAAQ